MSAMPSLGLFLVVMTAAQMLIAGAFNAAGVLAPVAAPALGFAPQAIGPYIGAVSVASLAGGMLIDGVLRRHGGARTLQLAIGFVALGVLLAGSGQLILVALSSLVIGWGGGMVVPSAIHLLSRVTPPDRAGLVFAINQCGIPLGFGLAGVVMPLLLLAMSWQLTLIVLAVPLALVVVALQPMRSRLDSDRDPQAPLAGRALLAPLKLAWTEPKLRLLGWLAFSYMTVQMCLVSYLVSYLNLELGHSHLAAGSALLASQLTAVVVRLLLGWLLDRVGGHLTVLAILGLGSGTLALMLGAASPAWPYATVLAVAMVAGGFMLGWNAVYFAAVARFAPPGRSGTAVGGTQIFTAVGSTVGPLLFAAIVSATGRYSIAFLALAGFSLVMGIRLLAQRWR